MLLVDTHCHLHFDDYQEDRQVVLDRAKEMGFNRMILIGTNPECSRKALELAQTDEMFYAACGTHPHDACKFTAEDMLVYEEMIKHPKIKAIGEVGLDFYRNHSDETSQIRVLLEFFKLHERSGLPLIFHIRDAHERFFQFLDQDWGRPFKGLFHCFSGVPETVARAKQYDFYYSFAGNMTYKKSQSLRDCLSLIPIDRLLFETDCPFLAPQKYRGRRNEPVFMAETCREAASVLGIDSQELAKISSENAARFFDFPLSSGE